MQALRRVLVAVKEPGARSQPAAAKAAQLARGLGGRLERDVRDSALNTYVAERVGASAIAGGGLVHASCARACSSIVGNAHSRMNATSSATVADNAEIAACLRQAADLLEEQKASPFRVNAYRRAALTVEELHEELVDLVGREGQQALAELPGVGRGITAAILEMLATGRWIVLDRLRGEADPISLFMRIPGIGPELARRIHDRLGIETLEDLEAAAHDGRLAAIPGIGARRVDIVRAGLAAILGRRLPGRPLTAQARPSVAQLLDVDAEYRAKAQTGRLRLIAPKRFNSGGDAWLPVMHTQREGWHYTALFSNTARAHELGKTDDWVVIYFYDHDHREAQCTVVTESSGYLRGLRVVRGREPECVDHYTTATEHHSAARAHSL